jgi:hypothetical protein
MTNMSFVLMLGSLLSSPFHFKDCVVVTKGFYVDCQGTVKNEWPGQPTQYEVTLNCKGEHPEAMFKADELRKCDK